MKELQPTAIKMVKYLTTQIKECQTICPSSYNQEMEDLGFTFRDSIFPVHSLYYYDSLSVQCKPSWHFMKLSEIHFFVIVIKALYALTTNLRARQFRISLFWIFQPLQSSCPVSHHLRAIVYLSFSGL